MQLRIGYGRLFHEANAYSPILTEREDFERMHHVEGEALARASTLRGVELKSFMPHAELTGFRQAARLARVETVPLQSSLAVPNGPVSARCFAWLLDGLERSIRAAGRLDGVYLALHGSMQVEGLAEVPEAVILRRVRAALGPTAKIGVSFDLHANLTSAVVDQVDVLVAYRTNPHWDLAPTGYRAGKRLIAALRGRARPVHGFQKLPMVLGGGTTIDFLAPMRGVFRYARSLEREGALTANLFMVHPYTTAADLGWAVHVTADGDERLAQELADRLADRAWSVRDVEHPRAYTVDEALDEVRASPLRRLGPITLVDGDDVVGAGAPGGNTRIVQALARDARGLKVYVPLHDPALVDETWPLPLGARRSVLLRGTPGYHAPEVALDVTVAARETTDFGRSVRLDAGSFHVVITDRSPLPIHPSFWSTMGLSPRDADAIVQKNFFHYRLFYATTSFRHLLVKTDGATSLDRVRTQAYRVPTHPRDRVGDWRDHAAALR